MKENKQPKKEPTIDKVRVHLNILEWLYANDGIYPSKAKWREEFLTMLKWNFNHLK